jgi:hypothetical protein
MPDKTVQTPAAGFLTPALASDDGPIFSTVAKLVEALKRSIPEGTQHAERKKEALRLGRELLRGRSTRRSERGPGPRPRPMVATIPDGARCGVFSPAAFRELEPQCP